MNYLLIFGGRDFTDEASCTLEIGAFMEKHDLTPDNTIIIEGGANGADKLAKDVCEEMGFTVETMEADWNDMSEPCRIKYNQYGQYNALAGMKRNSEMVDIATHAIGFWDGMSKGTEDSIKKIEAKRIPFELVMYEV